MSKRKIGLKVLSEPKIKIIKNGPYLVTGGVKLTEKIITTHIDGNYTWSEGRPLPQSERYALCRCGTSRNAPFCDGTHTQTGFDGTETADKASYRERAEHMEGKNLDLLDDGRCAFARFCHRKGSDVWEFTKKSGNRKKREQAIIGANQCPAGRLTALDKDGNPLVGPAPDPEIILIRDPEWKVSGGVYVAGNIPIESEDGTLYEVRPHVVLCRCGKSENKPFCDAEHVKSNYRA